jgi:fermentation-respiration switch protein FrsA (DUF1100 family)
VASGFLGPEQLHQWIVMGADGIERRAFLYIPSTETRLSLVISPHPFGFSAIGNLFGEAAGPRTLVDVPGVASAASRHGFAVLTLQSEGRRFTGMSVGLPSHLDAYARAFSELDRFEDRIDTGRIGACGLSMGGQEALLLATDCLADSVKAVAVQNPVTDLSRWYSHLNLRSADHSQALLEEIGGEPTMIPAKWASRSPIENVDALASTGIPVQIRVNEHDDVVPAETQGLAFATSLSSLGGSVEVIDDLPELDLRDPGRSAHEYVDWDSMLDWIGGRL